MQRLLRGWLLYVVLGALLVMLYGWTRVVAHVIPFDGLSPQAALPATADETTQETPQWFPDGFDLAALPQLMRQQPLLGIALSMMTAAAGGVSLAGIALTLWGLWRGRLRSRRLPAPPAAAVGGVPRQTGGVIGGAQAGVPARGLPSWSFGELGRIIFLTIVAAALLPVVAVTASSAGLSPAADPHLRITVSMLVLDLVAILVVLAFAVGKGPSVWETFGFSSRAFLPSLAIGLRGYVTMFPWLFAVLFVVVEVTSALGLKPPIEPIQELIFQDDRPLVLGLTTVLACVVGPVAEELFFRGVVFSTLRRRTSRAVAMLISGGAFALMHGNPVGFPSILLLGCLLAYLYERTGSLASSLSVHILHNTFLMSTALIVRRLMELA